MFTGEADPQQTHRYRQWGEETAYQWVAGACSESSLLPPYRHKEMHLTCAEAVHIKGTEHTHSPDVEKSSIGFTARQDVADS